MSHDDSTPTDAKGTRHSFRRSLTSLLLGPRSRSTEGTEGTEGTDSTGPARVPAPDTLKPSFLLAERAYPPERERVRAEDFADSESSRASFHTDEETKAAESIYSIIQEYDSHRQSFWFSEEFDLSVHSVDTIDAAAEPALDGRPSLPRHDERSAVPQDAFGVPRTETVPELRARRGAASGRVSLASSRSASRTRPTTPRASLGASASVTAPARDSAVKHASTASKETDASLSSGELLHHLDGGFRASSQTSTRNSAGSDAASRSLTVGVDESVGVAATAHALHDFSSPSTRWSTYDTPPALAPRVPRFPPALPVPIRDGTSLARRVFVTALPGVGTAPLRPQVARVHSSDGSWAAASHGCAGGEKTALLPLGLRVPRGLSRLSGSTSEPGAPPAPLALLQSGPLWPTLSSPAPSVTRESEDKSWQPVALYHDEAAAFWNPPQYERLLSMPWLKWLAMMLAALVAVPVFFLLALGAFDHAGFARTAPWRFALDDKAALANWRFRRRYTRPQKLASLLLGMAWVAVVYAMIAVGLGVGVGRS